MNEKEIKEILKRGRPWPEGTTLWGVSNLGAWYTEREVEAVVNTIRESMNWLVGFGPNPKEIEDFENAFAAYCGARYAVALNSCGTGLDIAMMCLNLEPGDEVICPAVNYKAAHLAIVGQGGKVVFCDIDPNTLNAAPEDIERRITPRTRAIMPVHMNGLPADIADIDAIIEIAERHPHPKYGPPKVIFDAARCCGATYKGSKIGDKGWMSVFSFQTQKFITTLGEGGMITTNDSQIIGKVRQLRHFGGEEGWGSNYKMTKVQAAVGLVQLQRLDEMNSRRKMVAHYRTELLKDSSDLILPSEPPGYEHLYYLYSMLTPKGDNGRLRDKLMEALAAKYGIMCSVTNPPMYERWPYIRKMCGNPALPVSDDIGRRLICLPIHPLMSNEINEYVCAALLSVCFNPRSRRGSGKCTMIRLNYKTCQEKLNPEIQLKDYIQSGSNFKIKEICVKDNRIEYIDFGSMVLTNLSDTDYQQLYDFYYDGLSERSRAYFPPYPLFNPYPESAQQLRDRIISWREEKDWFFFVLKDDRQITGVSLLKRLSTGQPVTGMAVIDKYHKRGLGSLLLKVVIAQGRLLNLQRIHSAVAPDNDASYALHKKCGFVPTGELTPHIIIKNGEKLTDRHDRELILQIS